MSLNNINKFSCGQCISFEKERKQQNQTQETLFCYWLQFWRNWDVSIFMGHFIKRSSFIASSLSVLQTKDDSPKQWWINFLGQVRIFSQIGPKVKWLDLVNSVSQQQSEGIRHRNEILSFWSWYKFPNIFHKSRNSLLFL